MGTDLSKPLDLDLSTGLDTNLAGSIYPLAIGAKWLFAPAIGGVTVDVGASAVVGLASGYTLLQAVGANQPAYEAVGPSSTGVPCLNYDGTNDNMLATDAGLLATLNSGTWENWIAFRSTSNASSTPAGAFDSTSTLTMGRHHVNSTLHRAQTHNGSAERAPSTTIVPTGTDGWAAISMQGTASRSVDTSAGAEVVDSFTLGAVSGLTHWAQGVRYHSAPSQYYNGRIYVDCGFDFPLSASQRAGMAAWIEALVGIA